MPKRNPDGSFTMTAAEMSEMFGGGSETKEPKAEPSFMDKWKEKLAPKKSSREPAKQQDDKKPAGGLTREALAERAKSMQFLKPTPEQLEKIQSGDMSAFLEAQQAALQQVFVDATLAADSISRHNTGSMREEFTGLVDNRLNQFESAKTIHGKTNDFMNFPGGDKIVAALTSNFASSNPDASPEDIGEMVAGHLKDFSSNFSKSATEPAPREAAIVEAQRSGADF
jgi:hypothetical protein